MSVWLIDADAIEVSLDPSAFNIIYENEIVKEFLGKNKLLGISAPKGLGKTFLLKHKRIKVQQSGAVCLPINKMLDILDSVNINANLSNYLMEKQNWLEIWKLAISLSLIKHYKLDYDFDLEYIRETGEQVYRWIIEDGMPVSTCDFFNRLLTLEKNDLNILVLNTPNIFHEIRNIRQSTNIFIDKTDQAFSHHINRESNSSLSAKGPREHTFWQYAQFYLAAASYSVLVENPHIKVYYGIRSEVLTNAEGLTDMFIQLDSYIATIKYSKIDLKNMFELYIRNEKDEYLAKPELKGSNPIKAFSGFDTITHGYVREDGNSAKESFFNYLYRHTLKRPRDIMRICYSIVIEGVKNVSVQDLKHIINKESEFIYKRYIEEIEKISFFLSKHEQETFASLVNTNSFSLEYIYHVCRYINKKVFCNKKCYECEAVHAFSAYFNIGLLGYLRDNNDHNSLPRICFNAPGDAKIDFNFHHLPSAKLFFLHPMFTNSLQTHRSYLKKGFNICEECIVGDQLSVKQEKVASILNSEPKKIAQIEANKIFIASTCFDLKNERNTIDSVFYQKGLIVIRSDAKNFPIGGNLVNSHDHCINEMLKCDNVIFIQGRRYGGDYCGKEYEKEKKEIGEMFSELKKPSISLMEYFVAKKRNIQVYSFIDVNAYNERQMYKMNMDNYKAFHVDDNRVFHIIDFITKQETGNWFMNYKDLNDLNEIVNIRFQSN